MNTPILPALEGLLGLSHTFSESASQKNWAEIEDLEKGEGASDGHVRQQLSSGTALSTLAGPADLMQRASVLRDGRTDTAHMRRAGSEAEELADVSPQSPRSAKAEFGGRLNTDGGGVTFPASASASGETKNTSPIQAGQSAEWQGEAEVILAPATRETSKRQAVETAAADVEQGLATSGPVGAAQKLHAAVRAMPAEQVSVLLDHSAPVIARIVEQAVRGENSPGVTDEKPRDAKMALVLAHVTAAVDRDPRSPSSMRLLQDLCAIILSPANQNDNATFSGLTRTIAIGAGVRLVLAVAAELAHRDENPSRAKTLVALMVSAFADLNARIDAAYSDVVKTAGPLCLEWLSWRDMGEDQAIARLAAFLSRQPDLLGDMAPRLERFEQAGLEAFRALRDLSAETIDPRLGEVRSHLLASPSMFAAVAGSRTAMRDIRRTAAVDLGGDDEPTIEMVRLTLTGIGFDAPRAAFLAELSALNDNALMLGSGWTALENFEQMQTHGRAFQRLLGFLNGQFVMAATPDVIGFGDDDMQV
ncbi:hypothetical protein ACRQ1B_14235 [Rhizobium panacihumi]|uniref:hypothetical protein n=1 Tax=Rhizobium panacihumi TaxID=2008450 RepID=UPI003D78BE3B